MNAKYTLFVYSYKDLEFPGNIAGTDYFNVLNVGKSHEEVLIEANAHLKRVSKATGRVILDFRVSDDDAQRFNKV
jgi:hypothetical protein